MSGRLGGCMQVCLEALAQSQDANIAAIASRALELQEASHVDQPSSRRLVAGLEYLALIETLTQRGAFASYGNSEEFAGLALTSVAFRRL